MTHRNLSSSLDTRPRVQTVPPAIRQSGGHALPGTLCRVRLASLTLPEDGADASEGSGRVDALAAVVAERLGGGEGQEALVDVCLAALSCPAFSALALELCEATSQPA